jgi:hypothetical protein
LKAKLGTEYLLSKIILSQATAFDDAFQRADGNRFIAMHGNNDLPSIFMAPFLMTARLGDANKTMAA